MPGALDLDGTRPELVVLDRLADHQSHRAYYGLTLFTADWRDPFFGWVAELGRREGEWLRDRCAAPAGLRHG